MANPPSFHDRSNVGSCAKGVVFPRGKAPTHVDKSFNSCYWVNSPQISLLANGTPACMCCTHRSGSISVRVAGINPSESHQNKKAQDTNKGSMKQRQAWRNGCMHVICSNMSSGLEYTEQLVLNSPLTKKNLKGSAWWHCSHDSRNPKAFRKGARRSELWAKTSRTRRKNGWPLLEIFQTRLTS